jgi:hypothetical protein
MIKLELTATAVEPFNSMAFYCYIIKNRTITNNTLKVNSNQLVALVQYCGKM